MDKEFNKDMAIVVTACDANLDIVSEYERYLKLNWPDCPFEIILVTEEKEYQSDCLKSVLAGDGTQWAYRALFGVDQCNCKYIMTMMEDDLIADKVNTQDLLDILRFMKRENIVYYKIPKCPQHRNKIEAYHKFKFAFHLRKDKIYERNLGVVIWERDTLKEIFGDGTKTAWEIEEYFNECALHTKEKSYFKTWAMDSRNVINFIEVVSGGKWMPPALNELKRRGTPVNIGNREIHKSSDSYRRKAHGIMNHIIPKRYRHIVKRIARMLGYKFVTEY